MVNFADSHTGLRARRDIRRTAISVEKQRQELQIHVAVTARMPGTTGSSSALRPTPKAHSKETVDLVLDVVAGAVGVIEDRHMEQDPIVLQIVHLCCFTAQTHTV